MARVGHSKSLLGLVAAVIGWGSATPSAHATFTCEMAYRSDGFIALRAGPSARSKLLLKIVPGNTVMLLMDGRRGWSTVVVYSDHTRTTERGGGWVYDPLLGDCG